MVQCSTKIFKVGWYLARCRQTRWWSWWWSKSRKRQRSSSPPRWWRCSCRCWGRPSGRPKTKRPLTRSRQIRCRRRHRRRRPRHLSFNIVFICHSFKQHYKRTSFSIYSFEMYLGSKLYSNLMNKYGKLVQIRELKENISIKVFLKSLQKKKTFNLSNIWKWFFIIINENVYNKLIFKIPNSLTKWCF